MYHTEVLVHYFQELESVYLLFTCWRPKFIAHPLYLYLSSDRQKKTTLPFLTAALRKHVQIHVIKTCRQASVTNSLVTLNCFNFTYPNTTLNGKRNLWACSKPRLHSDHNYFVNKQCVITPFHNLFSKFSG